MEVSLSGKLGRPMGITEADYDTELPRRVDDEYITEGGILKPAGVEGCSFDVGIELFKVVPLYIEINCHLYAVKRPSRDKYVELVESLEKRLVQWRNQVPSTISQDSEDGNYRFQAIQLELWFNE